MAGPVCESWGRLLNPEYENNSNWDIFTVVQQKKNWECDPKH